MGALDEAARREVEQGGTPGGEIGGGLAVRRRPVSDIRKLATFYVYGALKVISVGHVGQDGCSYCA